MNRKTILFLIIFSVSAILIQCKKETLPPVDFHHDYFPLEIGHYLIWDVDSVVYDDFTGTVDTFYYQVKELVESEFVDGDGLASYRLERYIRFDHEEEWSIKNIWKARIDGARALKTEENITFIKLAFPPENNKTWDGNAYNSLNEQQYVFRSVHEPFLINGLPVDSTVTVLQRDFETLISEDYQLEVYAKNFGLIYKKYVELTKEVDGTIIRGVDYSYTLQLYGMTY